MKNFIKYAMVINFVLIITVLEAVSMGVRPEIMTEYSEMSQGSIKFYVQNNIFKGNKGQTIVEFSYSMAFDQLQFLTEGKAFKAGYTISIIIYDENNKQIAGDSWERNIKADQYEYLQKGDSLLTDTLVLTLPVGEYRAKITCNDDNSDRMGLIEKYIEVPNFENERHISGIRFERAFGSSIIPWPNRIYGDNRGPIIFYFQLYNQSPETLSIKTTLIELQKNKPVWSQKRDVWVNFIQDIRITIPIDSFSDGNYILNLKIYDGKNHPLNETEYKIVLLNASNLTVEDYEEKISQVTYIARRGEADSLKRASSETRDSLWQRFWKSRDPTPDTEKNEFKDEYYEKVNFANQQYGSSIEPGWKTDMGRIYIKYGQPDEIEKHPFDIDSQPYEIWYYYQLGLKLVFIDKYGFGNYKLVNTNKEI